MRISDCSSDVCSSDLVGQDLRADRHLDHQILAARAGAVRSSAAIASLRTEMLGVAKVDQRVQPRDRFKDDIAALAAVAAVRAAIFDALLAAEGHGTGAAPLGRASCRERGCTYGKNPVV